MYNPKSRKAEEFIDHQEILESLAYADAHKTDRALIDDENAGLKSYQALWMRIQNEIVGERFNRFADMVDMDRLAAQEYTPEVIVSMSQKLAERQRDMTPLDTEQAEEILRQAHTGSFGIPQLICSAMQEVRSDV